MTNYIGGMPVWSITALANAVYGETNRPDMVQQTLQAIVSCTQAEHAMEMWYKDIQSAIIRFDYSQYIQEIDFMTLPRIRALAVLRKWDDNYNTYQTNPNNGLPSLGGATGGMTYSMEKTLAFFKIIPPDDIFDNFNMESTDVAYADNATIYMKSSTPFKAAKVSWYSHPNLGDPANNFAGYSSWIANEYPWLIIYAAAASIFSDVGQDAAAKSLRAPLDREGNGGDIARHRRALMINNTLLEGR